MHDYCFCKAHFPKILNKSLSLRFAKYKFSLSKPTQILDGQLNFLIFLKFDAIVFNYLPWENAPIIWTAIYIASCAEMDITSLQEEC